MDKTKLGEKRTCKDCGAKFYDFGKPNPTCIKCGQSLEKEAIESSTLKDENPLDNLETKDYQHFGDEDNDGDEDDGDEEEDENVNLLGDLDDDEDGDDLEEDEDEDEDFD